MHFLCGDRLLTEWNSGEAKRDLERLYTERRHKFWFRYLLGGSMACTSEVTGEAFSPDTDDEKDSGALSPYLNFRNPLWKIQLSFERHDAFKLLCDMLGTPPSVPSSIPTIPSTEATPRLDAGEATPALPEAGGGTATPVAASPDDNDLKIDLDSVGPGEAASATKRPQEELAGPDEKRRRVQPPKSTAEESRQLSGEATPVPS